MFASGRQPAVWDNTPRAAFRPVRKSLRPLESAHPQEHEGIAIVLPESSEGRWAGAAAIFVAGLGFNLLVQFGMQGHAPFQPFFTAVAVAAFWAGALPGLAVLAGSCASAWWIWTHLPGLVAEDQQPRFLAILAAGCVASLAVGLYVRGLLLERMRADQRLSLALAAGRLASWDWDLRTDRVAFSAGAEAVFGTAWEDARIGATLIHPDDAERVRRTVSAALAGHGDYSFTTRVVLHGSGAVRHMQTHAHVDRDARGRALRVSGVTLDVTDRVQESRRKDEFLATLAHELRNPMAPIRYSLALLGDESPPAARRKAREVLDRQCAHMARLLDDLLDISRITRNVIELRRQVIDLRELVRQALEGATGTLSEMRHRVVHEEPDVPVWVDGDVTRLAQVVGNLLDNAAKYTPPGGQVTLRLSLRGGQALIEVTDTGFGLTEEMRSAVFELFSQPHRPLKGAMGGLGIGLSVVRQLVELHGGRIEVESPGLDQGSTFRVFLPLASAPSQQQSSQPAPPPPPLPQGLRVLVVDDNRDSADLLAMLLDADGCKVQVAYTGADALALARPQCPDVAFLDIGLQDMTGYELAARLRALPGGAGIRLAAVTGWGQRQDRDRSAASGFELHLVKPVSPDAIRSALVTLGGRAAPIIDA